MWRQQALRKLINIEGVAEVTAIEKGEWTWEEEQ